MRNCTEFDAQQNYIYTKVTVADIDGRLHDFLSILDTGAPTTEFSDEVIVQLGYLEETKADILLQSGLQTQKYKRVVLPHIEICSRRMDELEVFVSHFDKSWGIKALIGLDFFKRFKTTIDYKAGHIVTEPY